MNLRKEEKAAEKPVVLLKEDLKENIISAINNSHLPLFLVEYVMKEIMTEVTAMSRDELLAERQKYNNLIRDEEAENPVDSDTE